MATTAPHRFPSAPRIAPRGPGPRVTVPEDHSVRSAVVVVLSGLVLVALLVGGGAVLATLVDLASWATPS
ncbi:hypothetical protein [Cellulomonas shaoxiangyii]|uniref:Uncharacterized protein n=1 Tax=Cellulomonas shaoxiangyii TaxID=2566013 RepID=A0A4P7SJY6_9CELL|nr:hypothetical protein [Cellulomonas shaoxiangyii]QCB92843.1 hypothetical protein E5225_04030 [Cellulomonas shaoxiangyii]TGY85510.1 hypothetical protein E5226_06180 [Cellulomonas shaoxiangyii]